MSFFGKAVGKIRNFGNSVARSLHTFSKRVPDYVQRALSGTGAVGRALDVAGMLPALAPYADYIQKARKGLSAVEKGGKIISGISKSVERGTGELLHPEMYAGGGSGIIGARHLYNAGRDTMDAFRQLRSALSR